MTDAANKALRAIDLALAVWPSETSAALRGWDEWSFYAFTGEWS